MRALGYPDCRGVPTQPPADAGQRMGARDTPSSLAPRVHAALAGVLGTRRLRRISGDTTRLPTPAPARHHRHLRPLTTYPGERSGFAGVILAGGRGERYGGPKALARLPDGRTFLTACADALVTAGANPIVATLPPAVSVPTDRRVAAVPLPCAGLAMFDSLRLALQRALEHAGWAAAVVLPVDHPLVAPETIRALGAYVALAAIPSWHGKHGHPVMLSRSLATGIVSGALAGPTLRDVLRETGAADVAVDDMGITANCNSPEALAAAIEARDRSRLAPPKR